MRIIAGEFRRRILKSPQGMGTRPIPDRVKESLFSMLGLRVKGASVLDLFAGSGAIGLEAVSRGAALCVCVERERTALATLQANIDMLKAGDRCKAVLGDALASSTVARCPRPVDLVFMDPPYPIVRDALGWARVRSQASELAPLLSETGFIILRTPWPLILDGGGDDDSPVLAPPGVAGAVGVPGVGGVGGVGGKKGKYKSKSKRDRFRWDDEANGQAGGKRRSPRVDGAGSANARGGDAAAISRRESLHRMKLTDADLDDEGVDRDEIDRAMREHVSSSEEQLAAAADDLEHGAEALIQDEQGRWVSESEYAERNASGGGGGGNAERRKRREAIDGEGQGGNAVPLPPGFDDALAAQHARKELAELTIPNCRGPETHVYGNMAVHFYMKQGTE